MTIFFIIFFAVVIVVVAVLIHIVSRMPSYTYRQGAAAERKVTKELATLPQEEYVALNDLLLPTSYGATQIDHVVFSTHGVYVIEIKDCRGNITGDEISEQWEQNFHGYRMKMGNALRQNKNHVDIIIHHARLNRNVPVYNIVAFTRRANFNIDHEHGKVIYIDELLSTIRRLRSNKPTLTKDQILIGTNLLLSQNIVDPELREKHYLATKEQNIVISAK